MIAQDLITKLQTIVHEHGLGLKDVVVDINGLKMQLADIDDIKVLEDFTSFGRGQMILCQPEGVYAAATEPRTDGVVAAW